LRQAPDVILIGEIRSRETMDYAIAFAETGHLVFSTLHTVGAAKTINRIIDVFPREQQQQVRVQLAMTLQGVISQQLLLSADGSRRELANEILITTPAVRNLIRESHVQQIDNVIVTGASLGMCTMEASLVDLVRRGRVTAEEAHAYALVPEQFELLMQREKCK
ncbi:MAG: ATPase, T2SS/T4P/T4SS family, partial [Pygmaiobacter sp.]